MTFAARLRDLLDSLHLTQRQAADRIGLSPRTLQDWAQGRRSPPPYAQANLLSRLRAAPKSAKSVSKKKPK